MFFPRPRTKKNETPADLARANGKTDVAQMLEEWPEFSPQSSRKDWLHDGISRAKAVKLIAAAKHPVVDGTFLIRKSTKTENSHVLTMFCEGEFNNFVIEKRGIYHCLDEASKNCVEMALLDSIIKSIKKNLSGLN